MRELGRDAGAGLNTGILSAAQSLTHGMIAFAPLGALATGFGMASALAVSAVAGVCVALLAGSRPLIGTTVASTALVTASLLAAAGPRDLGTAIILAGLLSGLAGLLMLAMAWTGIARVAAFVPTPVAIGLSNAIAAVVVVNQVPIALGLPPGQPITVAALHPASLSVAAVALFFMRRPMPWIPAPILALATGAGLHYALAAGGMSVGPVVGVAPSMELLADGLAQAGRAWTGFRLDGAVWATLVPAVASLAILGALETLAAGVALRQASGVRAPARDDLLGSAMGMLASAGLGGVPAAGLTSQTLACFAWGGRGRMAMLIRATGPFAALLLAGPVIAALPYAALAGVLVGAVLRLLQCHSLLVRRGAGYGRRLGDALIVVAVMTGALAFGLVAAVGIGVVLSIGLFTATMAQSAVRRCRRNPVGLSRVRRPQDDEATLRRTGDEIALLELEGAIFFGSAEAVLTEAERQRDSGASILILDLSRVTRIDASGGQRLIEACRIIPGRTLLAPLHEGSRAWQEFQALGLLPRLPPQAACATLPAAVESAENWLIERNRSAAQHGLDTGAQALRALGISAPAVTVLLESTTEEAFQPHASIIRQGEPAEAMYFLLEGQAAVTLRDALGRPATRLTVLAAGTFFGEAAILGDGIRMADVTAQGTIRCLRLDRRAMDVIRSSDPEAAWELATAVIRQLSMNLAASNAAIERLEN